MIYTKKANFPYPILMNFTDDYFNPEFEFDVAIRDSTDEYVLDIKWKVSSDYIKGLLNSKKASLVLVIKSKDNQFYKLESEKKLQVIIPKKRLCINSRTVMQLMIQTNDKIRLGTETILIVYKKEDYQFVGIPGSKELNYPYIYLGLQKALSVFLLHANPENPEEGILVDEMEPPENALESKLYSLMQSKHISELSMENMDEVIYKISDKLLMKYHDAVRGLRGAN